MDYTTFAELLKKFEHIRSDQYETFLHDRKPSISTSSSTSSTAKAASTSEAKSASHSLSPSSQSHMNDLSSSETSNHWQVLRSEFIRSLGPAAGAAVFVQFQKQYTARLSELTPEQVRDLCKSLSGH